MAKSTLNIGMSVPGANTGGSLYDLASAGQQVNDEEEEQRKKRLQSIKSGQQLPGGLASLASGYGAALSTK
jgi:hypothetical protein